MFRKVLLKWLICKPFHVDSGILDAAESVVLVLTLSCKCNILSYLRSVYCLRVESSQLDSTATRRRDSCQTQFVSIALQSQG